MAIHQDHGSERLMGLVDQPPQRTVIRLVERLDPPQRLIDRKPLAVDFLPVADHARDGAETAGDPHRARVGKARQTAGEHARIELIGLAIHVDIGARKIDPHGRKTLLAEVSDQLVHERILGTAQRGEVDPGGVEEIERIDRARMWRVEDDRRTPVLGLDDLERRRQFAIKLGHCRAPSLECPYFPQNQSIVRPNLSGEWRFYVDALSVIAIILPSEKSRCAPGTSCNCLKRAALIVPAWRAARKIVPPATAQPPCAFTRNLPSGALSVPMILQAGCD